MYAENGECCPQDEQEMDSQVKCGEEKHELVVNDEKEFRIHLQRRLTARIGKDKEKKHYLCIGVHGPLSRENVSQRKSGTHITVQREGPGVTWSTLKESCAELNQLLQEHFYILFEPLL